MTKQQHKPKSDRRRGHLAKPLEPGCGLPRLSGLHYPNLRKPWHSEGLERTPSAEAVPHSCTRDIASMPMHKSPAQCLFTLNMARTWPIMSQWTVPSVQENTVRLEPCKRGPVASCYCSKNMARRQLGSAHTRARSERSHVGHRSSWPMGCIRLGHNKSQ